MYGIIADTADFSYGSSWNLWNNIWGTNYPQWYPHTHTHTPH